VDRHVRPVRLGPLALLDRLTRHHRSANHELTQEISALRAHPGAAEGQHVGCPILVPVARIQTAAPRLTDHADGEVRRSRAGHARSRRAGQRRTRPGGELRAPRRPRPSRRIGDIEFEPAWHRSLGAVVGSFRLVGLNDPLHQGMAYHILGTEHRERNAAYAAQDVDDGTQAGGL